MKKLILSILFLTVAFCYNNAKSQDLLIEGIPKWVKMMQDPTVNFYDVQQEAEKFFKGKPTGKGTGWKQYKRWEYMNFDRTFPTGKRPDQADLWSEMKKFNANYSSHSRVKSNWEELGPHVWGENTGHWSPGI